MQNCIKHLIGEYEDAKAYYELACEPTTVSSDAKCKAVYRDLCENEIDHFYKLLNVYESKCTVADKKESNQWIEYFKHEVEELRSKLRQL